MRYTTVRQVYFSATGTTKKIVESIGARLPGSKTTLDLLRSPLPGPKRVGRGTLIVVGVPVFSGRVPPYALQSIANLRGDGGPAIAVAVYGNREYEDALLELTQTLRANSFAVIGAGAFIARHSIFPQIATGRPDAEDMEKIAGFADACAQKLARLTSYADLPPLDVKGNSPYREVSPGALIPSVDEACTLCGACVDICPVNALRMDDGALSRDTGRCFACAACIAACPEHAQAFRGPEYEAFGAKLAAVCAARKEPEIFI